MIKYWLAPQQTWHSTHRFVLWPLANIFSRLSTPYVPSSDMADHCWGIRHIKRRTIMCSRMDLLPNNGSSAVRHRLCIAFRNIFIHLLNSALGGRLEHGLLKNLLRSDSCVSTTGILRIDAFNWHRTDRVTEYRPTSQIFHDEPPNCYRSARLIHCNTKRMANVLPDRANSKLLLKSSHLL